jgi:hypothetical protein
MLQPKVAMAFSNSRTGTRLAPSVAVSREPLHVAVLDRGVATLEDYLGLATALIVDLQRELVTPEQASTLMLPAMPKDVKIPAAIAEEMCSVLLDRIKDGGGILDAASARFLPVLLRQLGPHHGLVERARAFGVLVDGA